MFHKKLQRAFNVAISASAKFNTIPFEFDEGAETLSQTRETWRLVHWRGQTVVVIFYVIWLISKFGHCFYNYHGFLTIYYFMAFFLALFFLTLNVQWRLWTYPEDYSWLFNVFHRLNKKYKYPLEAETTKDLVMSTWPQNHAALFLILVGHFLYNPDQENYSFSVLPTSLQSKWTVALFLGLEATSYCCHINAIHLELFLQALVFKSLIRWTKESKKIPGSLRELRAVLLNHQIHTLTATVFNQSLGQGIEQLKTVLAALMVYMNYLLVRKHPSMNYPMIAVALIVQFFCSCVPPFLYNECCQIYYNSLEMRRQGSFFLRRIPNLQIRRYYQKRLNSVRPCRIVANGLYFLDRMMTPMYLYITFNCTMSVLLMQS